MAISGIQRAGGSSYLQRRWSRRGASAVLRRLAAVRCVAAAVVVASVVVAGPATAVAQQGGFSDVAEGVHKPAIEALAQRGVFEGTLCGEDMFCPGEAIKRSDMAVWLIRALEDEKLPAAGTTRFSDVDADQFWAPYVERLAEIEITVGCRREPLSYCPGTSVSRGQMATFLVRAFDLEAAGPAGFVDTAGSTHEANIDALAAAGITVGCKKDPLQFCTSDPVRRSQMATFLARAVGLVETPSTTPTDDLTGDAESDLPGHPRNVRIDWAEGASLTVHWQAPANAGDVSFYAIDRTVIGQQLPDIAGSTGSGSVHGRTHLDFALGDNLVQDGAGQYSYVMYIDPTKNGTAFFHGLRDTATVRVVALNGLGYAVSSSVAVESATIRDHHELRTFVEDLVSKHGNSVPWLAEVRTYIMQQERSGQGFIFYNRPHGLLPAQGFALVGQLNCGNTVICKAASNGISVRYSRPIGSSNEQTVTAIAAHELAHVYTLSNDAGSNPLVIVVGHLYLQDLLASDPSRILTFGGGFKCSAAELYADLGEYLVLEQAIPDYTSRWHPSLGYWQNCQPGGNHRPSQEAIAIAKSTLGGEVPSWFYDTYQNNDGTFDLAALWSDVRELYLPGPGGVDFILYSLRDQFGGYCSDAEAKRAYYDPALGNPWRDGGCERAVPSGMGVAAGGNHSCGLTADGTIICWGSNGQGQRDAPSGIFIAVTAGLEHSCGLGTDQSIACWGRNWDIQRNYGGQIDAPSGTFIAVTAGYTHSCGLRTDQTITCWGSNLGGQTDAPAGTFTAISAGRNHSCGLSTDQTITCWGHDTGGETFAPDGTFSAVSAGNSYSCGVGTNQMIACWGWNVQGEADPPSGAFTAVSAAERHSCGLRADQTITCWGSNSVGQTEVPVGTFTAISVGGFHSCGITTDQIITCWGYDRDGQASPPATHFRPG